MPKSCHMLLSHHFYREGKRPQPYHEVPHLRRPPVFWRCQTMGIETRPSHLRRARMIVARKVSSACSANTLISGPVTTPRRLVADGALVPRWEVNGLRGEPAPTVHPQRVKSPKSVLHPPCAPLAMTRRLRTRCLKRLRSPAACRHRLFLLPPSPSPRPQSPLCH